MFDMLEQYDIFLVDAYGVFWDGSGFIPGTKATLQLLVQQNKIVIILSNTTQRASAAAKKYADHGLIKGEHYHHFVTSGEVARSALEKGLEFNGKRAKKYYNFGTQNAALFEGLDYISTSLEEAEFIYIGIPQLYVTPEEKERTPYPLYAGSAVQPGKISEWNSTDIGAFLPMLVPLVKSGLPVLNANPDLIAPEKCHISQEVHSVIRQGSIAGQLASAGMQVHQFGKPDIEVYAYCKNLLNEIIPSGIEHLKTAMVGDSLNTDILGAYNASTQLGFPVDGILTLTGNGRQWMELNRDSIVAKPAYVITSFGIEGRMVQSVGKGSVVSR